MKCQTVARGVKDDEDVTHPRDNKEVVIPPQRAAAGELAIDAKPKKYCCERVQYPDGSVDVWALVGWSGVKFWCLVEWWRRAGRHVGLPAHWAAFLF